MRRSNVTVQRSGSTDSAGNGRLTMSVGTRIACPSSGCDGSGSSRAARSTSAIASTALTPRSGREECDGRPSTCTISSARPRWPTTTRRLDGSQITATSGRTRRATATVAKPSIISSAIEAETTTRPRCRRAAAAPWISAASGPFMSVDPRPYSRPSRSSPAGSADQAPGSVTPTVSMCASNSTHGPGPASSVPTTLPSASTSTAYPSRSSSARTSAATAPSSPDGLGVCTSFRRNASRALRSMPTPRHDACPRIDAGTEEPVTAPRHIIMRRRLTAVAGLAGVVVAAALLAGNGGADEDEPQPTANEVQEPPPPELPRGGRSVLPEYRVVAYYGAPQSRELGALGIGKPDGAARRLAKQARRYRRANRPELPALELIAVIANADPGEDGMYRSRQEDKVIRRYLRAARRAKALLLLDIQPGRSDFFTETTRLEKWLKEPDVSLALDPEWRVGDGEVPGQVIGHVSSREVNATSAWLAQLVERENLPEKLFVIHQFTDDMVDHTKLKQREQLATVLNVDGFGAQEIKSAKYRRFAREAREFHPGFKLFFEEDTDLMTPRQVMRLKPRPDLIVYE